MVLFLGAAGRNYHELLSLLFRKTSQKPEYSRSRLAVALRHAPTFKSEREQSSLLAPAAHVKSPFRDFFVLRGWPDLNR
jgi:hypothetical protein